MKPSLSTQRHSSDFWPLESGKLRCPTVKQKNGKILTPTQYNVRLRVIYIFIYYVRGLLPGPALKDQYSDPVDRKQS